MVPSFCQKFSFFIPPREPLLPGNRFSYLTLDMRYTIAACQGDDAPYAWLQTARKIALITVFPFLMLAAIEGVGKNGLFICINGIIGIGNTLHSLFCKIKKRLE